MPYVFQFAKDFASVARDAGARWADDACSASALDKRLQGMQAHRTARGVGAVVVGVTPSWGTGGVFSELESSLWEPSAAPPQAPPVQEGPCGTGLLGNQDRAPGKTLPTCARVPHRGWTAPPVPGVGPLVWSRATLFAQGLFPLPDPGRQGSCALRWASLTYRSAARGRWPEPC